MFATMPLESTAVLILCFILVQFQKLKSYATILTVMSLLTTSVFSVFLLAIFASTSGQWNPNFAPGRNAIVHLFEWKWTDIEKECVRFLGPQGFGGVQVSPPSENVIEFTDNKDRPWSERYTPISYQLKTRSGTEEQFRKMVETCNNANVRIYVDAIINHMSGAAVPVGAGTGGSSYNYNSMDYAGVPYSRLDFNGPQGGPGGGQICPSASGDVEDWGDVIELRNCRLGTLIDLNQGSAYVRGKIAEYMNRLIGFGVAGFRIDAAKHMWPADLELLYDELHSLSSNEGWFPPGTRPFIYQEVHDFGDNEPIRREEYIGLGRVIEFKYAQYLGQALRKTDGKHLSDLKNYESAWGGLMDSANAQIFVDNHDNQRDDGGRENVITFRGQRLYKQAQAFTLAIPYGTPSIMSSYFWEQDCEYGELPDGACVGGHDKNDWFGPPHDRDYNIVDVILTDKGLCDNGWICEHRWPEILQMVKFRNVVAGTGMNDWWDNGNDQIAFCRGDKGFVAFNNENVNLNESLQTCLSAGTYCEVISGGVSPNGQTCFGKSITVDSSGYATIMIPATEASPIVAIHVEAKLS